MSRGCIRVDYDFYQSQCNFSSFPGSDYSVNFFVKMNVTCSICEQNFDSESNFANHFMIQHTISTLDPTDEKMEKMHLKKAEIIEKINCSYNSPLLNKLEHVCDMCARKFLSSCQLACHVFTHIGAMPYFCTFCNFSTISKKHLQNHLYKHKLEASAKEKRLWRPLIITDSHECEICNLSFVSWIELTIHYVNHVKQMPFICETCNLVFNEKKDYIIHCHLHKDITVCDLCYTFFCTRFEFLKHVISHNKSKLFRKFEYIQGLLHPKKSNLSGNRAISINAFVGDLPKSTSYQDLDFEKSFPCPEVDEQNRDICRSNFVIETDSFNSSKTRCADESLNTDFDFKSAGKRAEVAVPVHVHQQTRTHTPTENMICTDISDDGEKISNNGNGVDGNKFETLRDLTVVVDKLPSYVRTMRSYRRYAALLKKKKAKERRLKKMKTYKSSATVCDNIPPEKAYSSSEQYLKNEFETCATAESSAFMTVDAENIECFYSMDAVGNNLNGECLASNSRIDIKQLEISSAISHEAFPTDMYGSPERCANREFSNETCDLEMSSITAELVPKESENARGFCSGDLKANTLSVESHATELPINFKNSKPKKIKLRRKKLLTLRKRRIKSRSNCCITPKQNVILNINNSFSQPSLSNDNVSKKSFRSQKTGQSAFKDKFKVQGTKEHVKNNSAVVKTRGSKRVTSNSVFNQNQILSGNGPSSTVDMVKNGGETKPANNSSDFASDRVPSSSYSDSSSDIFRIVRNLKELSVVLVKLPKYVCDMSSYKTFLHTQNSGKTRKNVKERNVCLKNKICQNNISKNKQLHHNGTIGSRKRPSQSQYLGVLSSMILRRKQKKSYKFNLKFEKKSKSFRKSEKKAGSLKLSSTNTVPSKSIKMEYKVKRFDDIHSLREKSDDESSDDSLLDLLGKLPDVLGPTSIPTGPICVDKPCQMSALLNSSKEADSEKSILSPALSKSYLGRSKSSNFKIAFKSRCDSSKNHIGKTYPCSSKQKSVSNSIKQPSCLNDLKVVRRRINNIRRFLTHFRREDTSMYLSRCKRLEVKLHKLPDLIYQKHLQEKPIMLSLICPVVENVHSLQDEWMTSVREILNEHNYFNPHFDLPDKNEHNYCKTNQEEKYVYSFCPFYAH